MPGFYKSSICFVGSFYIVSKGDSPGNFLPDKCTNTVLLLNFLFFFMYTLSLVGGDILICF